MINANNFYDICIFVGNDHRQVLIIYHYLMIV